MFFGRYLFDDSFAYMCLPKQFNIGDPTHVKISWWIFLLICLLKITKTVLILNGKGVQFRSWDLELSVVHIKMGKTP